MFMKQYNYKPRSGSQSGGTSGTAAVERTDSAARADSPPKVDAAPRKSTDGAGGAVSGAIAGRRRSSDASGKFAGLNNYKRNSQDEGAAARKASWAEQSTAGQGILGGMWNNFTKGK